MYVLHTQVKWPFALDYLDEIAIFLRMPDEQIDHVQQLLTLLHDAGVTWNLNDCKFFRNVIDYLGHVTRLQRLEISIHTIEAIHGLQ